MMLSCSTRVAVAGLTVSVTNETAKIQKDDRSDFRVLAKGLDDPEAKLTDEEWLRRLDKRCCHTVQFIARKTSARARVAENHIEPSGRLLWAVFPK